MSGSLPDARGAGAWAGALLDFVAEVQPGT